MPALMGPPLTPPELVPLGIYCDQCGRKIRRTIETKPIVNGIRRRLQCTCGHRVTTKEYVVPSKDRSTRGVWKSMEKVCKFESEDSKK